MNCARMEKRLIPYLDGRLSARKQRAVEEHLAACAACRLRVDEFRAVAGLLGELPQIGPSGAFDARVRTRVAAEPRQQGWWAWLMPSPRVAFAAALLTVLVVWVGSRPTDPDNYPYHQARADAAAQSQDDDFQMIKDLPVLEDYDVLANFEPLSSLPQQPEQPVAESPQM